MRRRRRRRRRRIAYALMGLLRNGVKRAAPQDPVLIGTGARPGTGGWVLRIPAASVIARVALTMQLFFQKLH